MAAIADIRSKFKLKKKKNWQKEKERQAFSSVMLHFSKKLQNNKRNRLRTRFPGS